ncbi:GNAT family N-acetyltransferase [Kitasatospora sp. NPDC004669]|uniref:GNAT family N-acetyltransferase n=1 Tax=Kitasatospora sp. NPDC004669 TaxID=3154555 RepID=UPI0033B398B7
MDGLRILVLPEAGVPRELKLQVAELQEIAWPGGPSGPAPGADPVHDPALRPLSLLLLFGDRVLAALDLLSKGLVHAGRTYAATGLSTVVTDPAHRGRGYGRHLVAAARAVAGERGADLGLFTCDRGLQGFYEGAGWEWLPGAVLVGGTAEEPFPSDREGFDKVVLAAFFTERARRHRADFPHRRIALHPGAIDKLW